MFSFDCNGCSEYDKEQWGCEKAAEYPIWSDEDGDFYNCLVRFITPSTYDFLSRYDAIKNGWAVGLPFDNTLNRFVEAVNIFEHHLAKFEAEKQPEASNDLSVFRGKKNG